MESISELKNINDELNSIAMFMGTKNNIYSFELKLTGDDRKEFVKPIQFLFNSTDEDFVLYDPVKDMADKISYITKELNEYEALKDYEEIYHIIETNGVEPSSIKI